MNPELEAKKDCYIVFNLAFTRVVEDVTQDFLGKISRRLSPHIRIFRKE